MSVKINKISIIIIFVPLLLFAKKSKTEIPDSQCIVYQDNLYKHVEFLSKVTKGRNINNKQILDSAAFYIEDHLADMGYIHQRQKFKVRSKEVWNIIVKVGKGPLIVVGAHYDVFWDHPGADDNASGVAGLLEIARILKENENKLKNSFEIVFFTLEEPPHFNTIEMGSYHHATTLSHSNTDIKLMICLDMIGYYSNEKIQEYPLGLLKLFYPKTADFISVVGNYKSRGYMLDAAKAIEKGANIKVCHLAAPSWIPGIDFSDHANYWGYKYKAIMITNTSFYRFSGYHTMHDTIEKLDFYKMSEVVIGLSKYLLKGI